MAQWKHEFTEPPVDLRAYNPLPRIEMPSADEQQRNMVEAYRRVAADGIDHILDRLPQDMERLCKNIDRLLDDADPRVTGDELKFVSDAELVIKEQLNGALLAIALAKSRYRNKLARAQRLEAAE